MSQKNGYEEQRKKIEGWLRADNITFHSKDYPVSSFALEANIATYTVRISEPKQAEGTIVIATGLQFGEEDIATIKNKLLESWPAFLVQLRLEVSSREIFFTVNSDYARPDWLSMQRILYVEDMNRTTFMHALRELVNSLWRVQTLANVFLSTAGGSQIDPQSQKGSSFIG